MLKSLDHGNAPRRGKQIGSEKDQGNRDSFVKCAHKTNPCNHYVQDGLHSGQNESKLSIDDESSHPINSASSNNKSERKRNINISDDEDTMRVEVEDDYGTKRIKFDVNCDEQDHNKSQMYQVSSSEASRTLMFDFKMSLITISSRISLLTEAFSFLFLEKMSDLSTLGAEHIRRFVEE